MARSKNKVNLLGNIATDLAFPTEEKSFLPFGLATNYSYKDRQTGERKEGVEFHRVVANANTATYLFEHARKGTLVDLEGRLRTRKWQDQAGADQYTTEIVINEAIILAGWKNEKSDTTVQPAAHQLAAQQAVPAPQAPMGQYQEFDDADIPGFPDVDRAI